jgi:hypothetical protein
MKLSEGRWSDRGSDMKEIRMDKSRTQTGGYLIAAIAGAAVGGIAVAAATRAIPTMMSRIMVTMMGSMMTNMRGEGCDPEEM